MKLHYHPGKANVVADALSHKSHVNTLMTGEIARELAENLQELCQYPRKRGITAGISRESQGASFGDSSKRFCGSNGGSVHIIGKDLRISEG